MNIMMRLKQVLLASICISSIHAVAEESLTVSLVRTAQEVASLPTLQSDFRVHFIDVGTGLSVLIEGPDFNLLFDAGSVDDKRGNSDLGSRSRVVAYLNALFGANAKKRCVTLGDSIQKKAQTEPVIDYLFLSHPHEDHMSHIPSVLECFRVAEVWEPGIFHNTVGYKSFRKEVFGNDSIRYRAAAMPFCSENNLRCTERFSIGDEIKLGKKTNAKAIVLHSGTKKSHSPNSYSIVLRVELGDISVLLTGDAESGTRALPDKQVGDVEKYLLEHFKEELKADILQVGHHGSMTSSRVEFINAVSPSIAVISAGPKKYGAVVLPDKEVELALVRLGIKLLNTNLTDKNGCPVLDKVGTNERKNPGGCDNYVISIR